MKRLSFLILSAILVLAACAPKTNAQPTAQATVQATAQATATVQSLSNTLGQATATQPAGQTPAPAVKWNTSPEAQIVSATYCCGHVPEAIQLNYIPDAQIFGDGRIVWVQTAADGQRKLLEGKLPQDQLARFLQSAVNLGFFDWQELYTVANSPTDMASKCLFIQVERQSKRVCEYFKGAPQPFHDLYSIVAQGGGVTGQEFTPKTGFLIARMLDGPAPTNGQAGVMTWDSTATGFSLSQAAEGVWLKGTVLEAAWMLVNVSSRGTFVIENGKLYQVSLQIPGLSMVQPPK
jgi:hypothetical protein